MNRHPSRLAIHLPVPALGRRGWSQTDGRGRVGGEKLKAYQDTWGVSSLALRRLLRLPDTGTIKGLQDALILRLMCENGLRRADVCALDIEDFDPERGRLMVLGKGHRTDRVPITLSEPCTGAIAAYISQAGHAADRDGPRLRSEARRPGRWRKRITPGGIYYLVRQHGRQLGIGLAPHRLRHSAITAALDATRGYVRRGQRLRQHAKLETLMVYDDNRTDMQGQITDILNELLYGSEWNG